MIERAQQSHITLSLVGLTMLVSILNIVRQHMKELSLGTLGLIGSESCTASWISSLTMVRAIRFTAPAQEHLHVGAKLMRINGRAVAALAFINLGWELCTVLAESSSWAST